MSTFNQFGTSDSNTDLNVEIEERKQMNKQEKQHLMNKQMSLEILKPCLMNNMKN